jgi:hypothetical protein
MVAVRFRALLRWGIRCLPQQNTSVMVGAVLAHVPSRPLFAAAECIREPQPLLPRPHHKLRQFLQGIRQIFLCSDAEATSFFSSRTAVSCAFR